MKNENLNTLIGKISEEIRLLEEFRNKYVERALSRKLYSYERGYDEGKADGIYDTLKSIRELLRYVKEQEE